MHVCSQKMKTSDRGSRTSSSEVNSRIGSRCSHREQQEEEEIDEWDRAVRLMQVPKSYNPGEEDLRTPPRSPLHVCRRKEKRESVPTNRRHKNASTLCLGDSGEDKTDDIPVPPQSKSWDAVTWSSATPDRRITNKPPVVPSKPLAILT